MNEIYREVGGKIRAKRHQLGLTLEDLAELADLPASYIGQIERGVKKASLRSIAELAKGLGVSVGSLFAARGPKKNSDLAERLDALLRSNDAAERKVLLSALRQLSKGVKSLRRAAATPAP
jgi:transcriptional regulator with XRE-family HTH domain